MLRVAGALTNQVFAERRLPNALVAASCSRHGASVTVRKYSSPLAYRNANAGKMAWPCMYRQLQWCNEATRVRRRWQCLVSGFSRCDIRFFPTRRHGRTQGTTCRRIDATHSGRDVFFFERTQRCAAMCSDVTNWEPTVTCKSLSISMSMRLRCTSSHPTG